MARMVHIYLKIKALLGTHENHQLCLLRPLATRIFYVKALRTHKSVVECGDCAEIIHYQCW